MLTAMGHPLEAVGVTGFAIELWTAVLILCRPANHVGAHGLGGCQMWCTCLLGLIAVAK